MAFCALGLSITAAYYSVVGLSKLFAGVATAVIVMASFLEFSKLTLATFLHSYWEKIGIFPKIYYTTSLIILSILTSAGIYGMLSSGYQTTANKANLIDSQVELLDSRKESFNKIKNQYEQEKTTITANISELRTALGSNTQSYVDKKGNLITYSSSANRKVYEKQLEIALEKDEKLTYRIQTLNDSIMNLELNIMNTETDEDLAAELGPLRYVSTLFNVPMDKVVNYLLLTIIFVFDPLAIALILATNFAFDQIRRRTDEPEPVKTSILYRDGNNEQEGESTLEKEGEPVKEEEVVYKKEDMVEAQIKKVREDTNLSTWKKNKILKKLQDESFGSKTYF